MSLPAVTHKGQDQKAGENGIRGPAPRGPSPRESEASRIAASPAIYARPRVQRAAATRIRPTRSDDVSARPANPAPAAAPSARPLLAHPPPFSNSPATSRSR